MPDPAATDLVAQVVVGLPVPRVFSYVVPARLADLQPGQRIRVPFRGRRRVGIIVGLTRGEAAGLEVVDSVLDPVPTLTAPLLELTRWAAAETASAWGEAVARALPPSPRAGAPSVLGPEPPLGPPGPLVLATGSGRHGVIERAAEQTLGEGRAVLLLAPEIESAGEWAARLDQRLGAKVALVTSAERPRRRWEAWWAARQGGVRVAVGTRVAAFLPLTPLGLAVVVDEEDPAHKAPDAPRWHARELAIRRTALEGGRCLLASAAPSLDSWMRVGAGKAVAEEVPGAGWPRVHRVDLRATDGTACLSPALLEAARATLAGGRSVVLVLNRLGYGLALGCPECGAIRRCATCRLALTYHRAARALVCRLCGVRSQAASLCPRCRGRRLAPVGWGTERLEAEARRAFRGVEVARYDGTVPPLRAAAVRAAFQRGEARVLVGTQMAVRLLADRPVGLAALALVDATLALPDFRAGERTFQLAWRLGEGVGSDGELWLQSFYPDHPSLAAVAARAPAPFYAHEWSERQALGYPPARRMARLVAEGPGAPARVGDLVERCAAVGLTVLGPATLPGRRLQVVLLGGAELPHLLAGVLEPLRGRRRVGSVRLAVDVDPV